MRDGPGGSNAPLRADAQRNHDALLAAAAGLFAAVGVDAPIKAIADRAGVGVATVYRRFPHRSDLILAVFRYEVDSCAAAAEALAAQHPPFEALTRWIDQLLDLIITKRGLSAALRSDAPALLPLRAEFEARLAPSLQRLMDLAGDEIAADISAAELWRAVALLCAPATAGDFAETRRMVALLVGGLRVDALGRGVQAQIAGPKARNRAQRGLRPATP